MRGKSLQIARGLVSVKLLLLVAPLLLADPALAQRELQLVFGVYTTDKPTVLVKKFRPMLSAIETDLGKTLNRPVSIRLQIARSYERGVSAIVNGEVDFSRFGPASYVAATRKNPALRILALDSKNDTQTTTGIISVHEDSLYTKVSELKNARFAFGNKASTIGRYLSQAYLLEHGVHADDLAEYEYLERHDRVGYAVAQGSYDAGALKEGTFIKLRKKGLPLRALAKFENVNKPWIARSGMDEKLFESLRTVMLTLSAPDAFKALGSKQFVHGDDAIFEVTRKAINDNPEFFKKSVQVKTSKMADRW